MLTFHSFTPIVPNHDIPSVDIPKVSQENQINTNNSAIEHIPAIQNCSDMYQLLLRDGHVDIAGYTDSN